MTLHQYHRYISTAAVLTAYMFLIWEILLYFGCTIWTVDTVHPPCVRGRVGALPSKVYSLTPGLGEGLLALKSAKPCSPFRSDPHAARLQTRCPFSEHGVHVAGGRDEGVVSQRERGVRFDRNTGTSSYYLVK